jgi:hypothetical protein
MILVTSLGNDEFNAEVLLEINNAHATFKLADILLA